MAVIVQRLTDDDTFEEIGRVEEGEIVAGEDALTAIDSQAVWEGMDEGELAARFSGPRIMAGITSDDGDDTTAQADTVGLKQTPEGVPEGYEYVAPDEEVGDEYDVVQSPQGATYRSPQPTDDEDDGSDTDAGTVTEVTDEEIERAEEQYVDPMLEPSFVMLENEVSEQALREGGATIFASVGDDMADKILESRGSIYDYEDEDASTIASADAYANDWMMSINASRIDKDDGIDGTIQHEFGHVIAGLAGWQPPAGPATDILPNPREDDDAISSKGLYPIEVGMFERDERVNDPDTPDGLYIDDPDLNKAIDVVNERFQEVRKEAREIQENVPDDAEGVDQYAGMAHLEEQSPAGRAYGFTNANEFWAESVRAITSRDPEKRDFLEQNHPELYDAMTEVFNPVPTSEDADGSEPIVSRDTAEDDDYFETYSECVDVNDDKEDPESYCAVIFGFDEPEDDEEDDETESEADPVGAKQTPEGVPEGYQYVPPDEEVGDEYDVVQSPGGATYRSPQPVDGGDGDGDSADAADADAGEESAADRADTTPEKATPEAANEAAAAMEREVADILGSEPSRDEFEAAEQYVAEEVNVEEVDFSSFDAAQAETASAELARMNETNELSEIDSFRSSIPETVRATEGTMPAHYDRDGRGMSVDPNALGTRANQRLSEAGVTSTPSETHMMEHVAALTEHIESLEEGNGEADEDTTIEEAAEETGVDLAEVARTVGQLSVATTATLVAETYVMARNGYPQPEQVGRLYRFLGGPSLGDFR